MNTNTLAPIANPSAVLDTIASRLSPSTRLAYQQSVKVARNYFDANGLEFYPLTVEGHPDTTRFIEQVLLYLQTLLDSGRTASTLNKTLSAFKWDASHTNPLFFNALHAVVFKNFMEGVARTTRSHTPRKASALTVPMLTDLYSYLNRSASLRAVRDKALISLGIATALRSSNLAELRLADVSSTYTIDGLNVRVRFSKTDQEGHGAVIPVLSVPSRLHDPVSAVNKWLSVLEQFGFTRSTHPDYPLFPNIRGERGLTSAPIKNSAITISRLLRSWLVESGVVSESVADLYSSHSLRATFITLSSQAGVAENHIAEISGHKDMSTLRSYDRTSQEQHAQNSYLTHYLS